jgi:hypothetical protein
MIEALVLVGSTDKLVGRKLNAIRLVGIVDNETSKNGLVLEFICNSAVLSSPPSKAIEPGNMEI